MDSTDDLVLNLTTNAFSFDTDPQRKKTTKKERFQKNRQERRQLETAVAEEVQKSKEKKSRKESSPVKEKKDDGQSSSVVAESSSVSKKPFKRKNSDRDGEGSREFEPASKLMKQGGLFEHNPYIPQLGNVKVDTLTEEVFSAEKFSDMNLHPFMVSQLEKRMSVTQVTHVQKTTIPNMLSGRDVLVKSQTGSGKTIAYAVPIVQELQGLTPKIERADGTLAIVIVPTRELAMQSLEVFQTLTESFKWVVPGALMGGEKRKTEKARLRKGLNIVISTPGRLVDHIENTRNLELGRVKWLVIDEADRLLDMGFQKDVASVVAALKERSAKDRQTALLSATLTPGVEKLAGMSLENPVRIDMTEKTTSSGDVTKFTTPENLTHHCVIVPCKLRMVTLAAFLLWKCKMAAKRSKMLVFMATQDSVDFHHQLFKRVLLADEDEDEGEKDPLFYRLHGDMAQKERMDVFSSFSRAESGVLFCTDVAARGLDLPLVRWIIQYVPPGDATDYIHRVGRTARIGGRGNALLFLTPSESSFTSILSDNNIKLDQVQMDDILQTLYKERGRLHQFWPETDQPHSTQEAASAVQARFIEHIRRHQDIRTLARKAFQSYIGAYSAYQTSVKYIFHVKNLHLGHVATSFALEEAPKRIGNIVGTQAQKYDTKKHRGNQRQGPLATSAHKSNVSEYSSGMANSIDKTAMFTNKEKRKLYGSKRNYMY